MPYSAQAESVKMGEHDLLMIEDDDRDIFKGDVSGFFCSMASE